MSICKFTPISDPKLLRKAFAQYPTGVAVVTAYTSEQQLIAMTINSFTSVSLSPGMLSWCVDVKSGSYQAFTECTKFTITVLANDQQLLAQQLAQKGQRKFDNVEFIYSDYPPAIANGCAVFHCDHQQAITLGDHAMLIGLINRFKYFENQPLIFTQGQFISSVSCADAIN